MIYNFLVCSFLFETRSYSYAITQEITVPIMVTLCRLCYCFKKRFFQHSLLYRKDNAHEDSIWSCAWGKLKKKNEENGDGEESRYVYSFDFTRTVSSALSGIYTRRAQIETTSRGKPEITHITQSRLTS